MKLVGWNAKDPDVFIIAEYLTIVLGCTNN
jgi:hypothetical protein